MASKVSREASVPIGSEGTNPSWAGPPNFTAPVPWVEVQCRAKKQVLVEAGPSRPDPGQPRQAHEHGAEGGQRQLGLGQRRLWTL